LASCGRRAVIFICIDGVSGVLWTGWATRHQAPGWSGRRTGLDGIRAIGFFIHLVFLSLDRKRGSHERRLRLSSRSNHHHRSTNRPLFCTLCSCRACYRSPCPQNRQLARVSLSQAFHERWNLDMTADIVPGSQLTDIRSSWGESAVCCLSAGQKGTRTTRGQPFQVLRHPPAARSSLSERPFRPRYLPHHKDRAAPSTLRDWAMNRH
jgi:hypothetical protein